EVLVDALCMGLVQRPEEFDVLVLPNLYGDIVSDMTAGLVGGLGVAPGANIGESAAVFEATHGSAPRYKGMNRVNPTAMILSGKLMLEHLGERAAAERLEFAVAAVIAKGERVTYDLKPHRDDASAVGTAEYADALIDIIPTSPQGKALDMNQAGAVLGYEPVLTGANGYEETADSDVVVITAGRPRAPGMSRDDLVTTNESIVSAVTRQAVRRSPKA